MPPKKRASTAKKPAPAAPTPAITHLFLARTFRTYLYSPDMNTEEMYGLFPSRSLAETAMRKAFEETIEDEWGAQPDDSEGEEEREEERDEVGNLKIEVDSGEGDKVIGRVTRIEMAPETVKCIKERKVPAETQKVKGEKPVQKRRKRVETEDEDEDGEPSGHYQF